MGKKKRSARIKLFGLLSILALWGWGVTPEQAVCTDCRQAPPGWSCGGAQKLCSLEYQKCKALPWNEPPPAEEEVGRS